MPDYIDTNVILRFLTGDPPGMAEQAAALFAAVERGEITLRIEPVVIAETVWVLKSFYGFSPVEISRVLQEFLGHEGLVAAEKPALLLALQYFAEQNIDFVDALVAARMRLQGVSVIYSFDRHFDRIAGIQRKIPGV